MSIFNLTDEKMKETSSTFTAHEIYQQPVALLAEGVDRNSLPQLTAYSALHPSIVNLSPIGLIVRGAEQKQKAA